MFSAVEPAVAMMKRMEERFFPDGSPRLYVPPSDPAAMSSSLTHSSQSARLNAPGSSPGLLSDYTTHSVEAAGSADHASVASNVP